jgi:hypothetical protein
MDERELISQAMRLLRARHMRVQGACAICGRPFEASTRRMYCSAACKQKAVRQRQREQAQETKPQTKV